MIANNITLAPGFAEQQILDAACFISIGFAGMICNLIVIVVIHASKPLHTPCFRLISGSAFGAFICAAFYFVGSIDGLGSYFGVFELERTRLQCLLSCVTGIFGIAFHSFATCLIGIDRLISLWLPVRYRNLGNRYVITVLSIGGAIVMSEVILIFAMTPWYETIECVSISRAGHAVAIAIYIGLNFFLCSLSVVVYSAMIACFYFKAKKFEPGSPEHTIFMKQQAIVMPTVRLLAFFWFVCGVLPEVIIGTVSRLDQTRFLMVLEWIANFLKINTSLVEFISLVSCCKGFRDSMKSVFCKHRSNDAMARASTRHD